MKILKTKDDLKEAILNCKYLGFVPTMGSLHKGHISLIKNSQKKSNKTIVSIFINPTQFNNTKDYNNIIEAGTARVPLRARWERRRCKEKGPSVKWLLRLVCRCFAEAGA